MATNPRSALIAGGLLLVGALVVAGPRGRPSSRPPFHVNPNMDVQPRVEPQAASAFFYDGSAMRRPVEGTVARGELRDNGPYWTGTDDNGFVAQVPLPVTDALRERGHRRFDIYCAACHDKNGNGKGILFERGKVPTPSFHQDRLRQAPDGYIFLVITNGFGLMPSYAYPIPVADRWAIVAYLRELQAKRVARELEDGGPAAAPSQAGTQESAPPPAAPAP
jgi:mono/diheme cytochrome c family protein